MQRVAVVAKLRPDAKVRAESLIEEGPPFDLDGSGFERHVVFVSGDQVIFVFEGGRLDQLLQASSGLRRRRRGSEPGSRSSRACPERRTRRTSGSAATGGQTAGASNQLLGGATLPGER